MTSELRHSGPSIKHSAVRERLLDPSACQAYHDRASRARTLTEKTTLPPALFQTTPVFSLKMPSEAVSTSSINNEGHKKEITTRKTILLKGIYNRQGE